MTTEREPFAVVPRSLIAKACEVYPQGFAVMAALLTWNGPAGMWPSALTLAELTNRKERAVRRALDAYSRAGLLTAARRRKANGQWDSVHYKLGPPVIGDRRSPMTGGQERHEPPVIGDTDHRSLVTADPTIDPTMDPTILPGADAPGPGASPAVASEGKGKGKGKLAKRKRGTPMDPEQAKRHADLIGYYRQRLSERGTKALVTVADAAQLRSLLAGYTDDELRRGLDAYVADEWPRAVGWSLSNFPKRLPGYLAAPSKATTAGPPPYCNTPNQYWRISGNEGKVTP